MKILNDVYQIDAFTKQPFNGNSAAVVLADDLTNKEMQSIAKEMNLSETAFISSSNKADYKLKWFTPAIEVELCGHATIASLHYLTERKLIQRKSSITLETLSGIIECRVDDDKYYMKLPVPEFKEFEGSYDEIMDVLGIERNDLDDKYPLILQNNGNLFIYVKTLDALKKLNPNFKELVKLSKEKGEFGEVTVFSLETFEKENDAHLRFFAPNYGIDEDPVTGSANGPLLLVLRKLGLIDSHTGNKIYKFEQGDFLGRKGRVNVSFSPDKNELMIAGNAVTVLKGELTY
ncbi:MAG: PhzF family phenazine biosynthesis protein [Ignavibacteriaceae bacterium]|nr:PhzF family phenazine biosynthesis protein [Ignavibacteriaceae bacterium]